MQPRDLARKFLELAARDCNALRVLAADNSIADETIGFHAQQAVEKCLMRIPTHPAACSDLNRPPIPV
jgi:HEPN domain-containing protein